VAPGGNVQIPCRTTHLVEVACMTTYGIFTQEEGKGKDDCLLSNHRSISSSSAIPRNRNKLTGSKKTMASRQQLCSLQRCNTHNNNLEAITCPIRASRTNEGVSDCPVSLTPYLGSLHDEAQADVYRISD
jgi:hypothetical protein